jgi:hypothetical protein
MEQSMTGEGNCDTLTHSVIEASGSEIWIMPCSLICSTHLIMHMVLLEIYRLEMLHFLHALVPFLAD